MIRSLMSSTLLLTCLILPVGRAHGQGGQAIGDAFRTEHDREFDFWVGEWDVNLRVRQSDNSWKDARFSQAKIYRVLDGKAILELWDEQVSGPGIRGYSLRLFDHEAGEWILYLNWPGQNRSGTSSLRGTFRHGRGEFFSTSTNQQGDDVISRYTFSDAAPDRLRWDDAFSRDGGRTWSGNWIMEFSRTSDTAAFPGPGERAHTYYTGARCDRAEFRRFEALDGTWNGRVRLRDSAGDEQHTDAHLFAFKVLDGCAVMRFLTYTIDGQRVEEFGFHTYNTYAGAYEEGVLDNQPGTPFHLLYGQDDDGELSLTSRSDAPRALRHVWAFDGVTLVYRDERRIGEEWVTVREVSLNPEP